MADEEALKDALKRFNSLNGRIKDNRISRLEPHLDRITFESENIKGTQSESSSRRHSDDGGRARQEGYRQGIFF